MLVGTIEAAFLLGICPQRVRQLLQQGRIKGAKKVSRFWQIPLKQGVPEIIAASRGPEGTWRKTLQKVSTYIHINQNVIKHNNKYNTREPVIAVKRGSRVQYCHSLDICGSSKIIYAPDCPKSCGARVWLEVSPNIILIPKMFS